MNIDVKYKLDHPKLDFQAYEFITEDDVFVPEMGDATDHFRLEIDKEGQVSILVSSMEEWWVHEDASECFDTMDILAECILQDSQDTVHDSSMEFIQFHKEQGELEYA